MADMTLVLKLLADAKSAIEGLQQTTAEVRKTGEAAREVQGDLSGMDAVLASIGDDGATVLAPLDTSLQDVGASGREAQGDMTLLGGAVAAVGDDGVTRLEPIHRSVLILGDDATLARTDLQGLGTALTGVGADGAAGFGILSAKLAEAMREIDLLKGKLAGLQPGLGPKLRDDTEKVGQAARGSAGQVGNLVAQFNDIGMMMAAGQNPLMTAIQQGSQVGQVLGPMGAAGSVRMLGQAFMGLLNPVNLGVMAAIAFGSTLVQWLVSGGQEAKSLEDGIADLKSAVTAFQTATRRSLADLQRDFGAVTPEVKRLNDEMADLAGVQAILAATEAIRGLKAETEGSWFSLFNGKEFTDSGQVAKLLGVESAGAGTRGGQSNQIIGQFNEALTAAETAQGLDAQIAAFENLRAIIVDAAGGIYSMTRAQESFYSSVVETAAALQRQKAAQTSGITPQAGRVEPGFAPSAEDLKVWADLAAARKQAAAVTREEVVQNQRSAALQRQIAAYGEDSARAAFARLTAERDAYGVLLNQRGVTGALADNAMAAWDAKNGIVDAEIAAAREAEKAKAAAEGLAAWLSDGWDAALGIATAGMDGNISDAVGMAKALAGWLWDAAMASASISADPAPLSGPAGMGSSPPTGGAVSVSPRPGRRDIDFTAGTGVAAGSGGGGGGGGSASNPLADLQAQAREAMVQLDQSIAAINEKVAVGLTSTADAANGIVSAKEQAANSLAEFIAQLDDMGPAGETSAAELRVALQAMAEDLKAVGRTGESIGKALGAGLTSPLADFILGTKSATQAFDDFVANMAQTIAQKLSARFTDSIVTPFLDSVVGAVFPGLQFAKGGVPGLADLSGQVLDRPTTFAIPGGGLGQAGEAGREAVMPLKEGPTGLSVRAWLGSEEVPLALTRGPDGMLGVQLPQGGQAPAAEALRAFATGGVPGLADLSGQVLDRPMMGAMPSGGMDETGDPDRETVMPSRGGGVRAVGPDDATTVPALTRVLKDPLALQSPSALGQLQGYAKGGSIGGDSYEVVGGRANNDPMPGGNLAVHLPKQSAPAAPALRALLRAFATGGVPGLADLSGQVLDRPTTFAIPGGGLGQAGEAGREAVVPLTDGPQGLSVRAWLGAEEVPMGLMRGPDGMLGVDLAEWRSPIEAAPRAYAMGGVPGQSDAQVVRGSVAAAASAGGPQVSPGNVYVTVNNNAQNTAVTQTDRMQGSDRFVDVMIDTVREAIADDIMGGRGPVPAAIEGSYGAQRIGR